ncbi:hypothetical protein ACFST9_06505 [Hymenobacter monticola]|uniref:DUF3826 domain-containing protein n=1 Tax=Hymenobacter monticola TaxID=1705399 RepID=A0ABY4BE37_9BACT|nr:hypothetical protein [Hymenobacter monticola]UOE36266.1 hypothetical protein MTP16_11625 [Hymenobacter monticola]
MKKPLPLFLLLPLSAFAQYRPIYSPTARPTYSAPIRTFTPTPHQQSQVQQQQAYQHREQMRTQQLQQAQQMQLMQQQQLFRSQQMAMTRQQQLILRPQPTPQQLEEAQALQDKAEQKANDQLAQLAAEQQRQRQEHPTADAQQATVQQQADAQKLNALAVKNYREVFLPWQVGKALQARGLSAKGQQDLQAINKNLSRNGWWKKQEPAQLNQQVADYGKTLTSLTADLLGFDLATPPAPAPPSANTIDDLLAKPSFDQAAATQLIRETAQAEKIAAGVQLAKAVLAFNQLAATPSAEAQSDARKRRDEVKAGLRKVNQELQRYYAEMGSSRKLYDLQKSMLKATSGYLAKNGKA